MTRESFDYVVVGGGSAGCVVAARLAEDPRAAVCLIEAGPNDHALPQVQNVARWSELLLGELDFAYAIEPQLRGNDRLVHSRGRVLGGCSSHNSCIALRPSDRDFDRWEALGAEGWGPGEVEPFFARVLERVHLELGNIENALSEAFVESVRSLGFPFADFSRPFSEGVGWLPLNKRGSQRESSSNAYLHRPGVPDNLEIRTETRAVAIKWEGPRAAELVLDDATAIRAEVALVLAAGVFDTPKLLLLSGVGPPDDLSRMGIEVHRPLAGVGRHLIDHPEGVLLWELERPLPRASGQKYEAALFADPADAGRAEIMLHFGLEPFDMHTAPAGYPTSPNAISLTPNVCYARSEGVLTLRSADPGDAPVIDPRYFTDAEDYDRRTMLEGLRLAREIAAASPLDEWILRELAPGSDVASDAALTDYLRRTHNTVYHPAGTCRMGSAVEPTSVVTPDLRLIGAENVFVADASVFPEMVGVNPNLTVMMIGERCAASIKQA